MKKDELTTNVQSELFALPDAKPLLATGLTCRKCKHNQAWQCNSKVFHYCGIRKSKQTSNGQLKIKCKNPACSLFEPCC